MTMRAGFVEEAITKSFFLATLDVQLFPFLNLAVSCICYWLSIHITVHWNHMLFDDGVQLIIEVFAPFVFTILKQWGRFIGESGSSLLR